MALPTFTMRQLLKAGVHFGHVVRRWNPRMAPYIYGTRNGIHIIDLDQSVPLLYRAMKEVRSVVANGGRVLFVGTKRQASEKIAEEATRCGQHYVNHRWLGGMLTNWQTISRSIRRLKELEEELAAEQTLLTKKETLQLTRERDKLERALGGIKDMGGLPDILFVIDTNREELAIKEAIKLNIPIIAILDSNSDPKGITYPISGNDDAIRAIGIYCDLISGAVIDGLQEERRVSGDDVGADINAGEVDKDAAAETPQKAAAETPQKAAAETPQKAAAEQAVATEAEKPKP